MKRGRQWLRYWMPIVAMILFVFVSQPVVYADVSNTTGVQASPQTVRNDAESQLDNLDIHSIRSSWAQLQDEYGGYLPDVSGGSLIRDLLGRGQISWQHFAQGILRYFFGELIDNVKLLGAILILAVLAAVLESVQSAFERQAVSQVAYAMIFLVMMMLAIGSFTEAIGYAKHAIQAMNDFMLASIPLAVSLLAASGALASAAFFSPVLLFGVHLISNVVFLFVFPLIFFSAVLDITSALSPRYQLTRLAGLLRMVGAGALAVCMSVFLGITTIEGAGKGIVDGVTLRTAKVAVSTLIPVVGKALADAAETVASASLLVKNAVGVGALLILAFLALFPVLKILAVTLVYGGSAALMQPLGNNPMVDCLSALSKSLMYIVACVAAVALMFFVALVILLVTANVAVVMA